MGRIAALVTVILALVVGGALKALFGWENADAVIAVAVMGAYIYSSINRPKE